MEVWMVCCPCDITVWNADDFGDQMTNSWPTTLGDSEDINSGRKKGRSSNRRSSNLRLWMITLHGRLLHPDGLDNAALAAFDYDGHGTAMTLTWQTTIEQPKRQNTRTEGAARGNFATLRKRWVQSRNALRSDVYSTLKTVAELTIVSTKIETRTQERCMKTDYCSLNDAVAINAAPNAARHNPQMVQVGTLRIRDTIYDLNY